MSDTSIVKENKMGTMKMHPLFITMALPMVISMLVQALYNVVDSIFVAKLSEEALTAVSLAFPMQNLMIAVGTGMGVGINALLSKALGQKDQKLVNKVAVQGLFLMAMSYLVFLGIGIFAVDKFLVSQVKADSLQEMMGVINYGKTYLKICCMCSFGIFTQLVFERLLQSTGKTIYSMLTQGIGAIINIILDPILIFGLCGMPRLGIAGAAYATVIGQIIAGILGIVFNLTKNKEIHIHFKGFKFEGRIIKRILAVGIPSIIMIAIGSIMTFGMNKILMGFNGTATAVFGVYFKLQSFVLMPVLGMSNGVIPIIAYNLGAKNRERIVAVIRIAMCYAVGAMIIGLLTIQLMPEKLLQLFDASEQMIQMGVPALKTISLSFIFAGFCIISSSVFQALGNGILSMIVSIARQLVVLLPVAYFFARTGKLNYVWWSFPIAEVASVTLCIIFLRYMFTHVIEKQTCSKKVVDQSNHQKLSTKTV